MATERNQHRISSLLTRVACGFATFILALILSPHYNLLGPNISPADLDSHPIVVAKIEIPAGSRIIAEQLQVTQLPRSMTTDGAFTRIDGTIVGRCSSDQDRGARTHHREPARTGRFGCGFVAGDSGRLSWNDRQS